MDSIISIPAIVVPVSFPLSLTSTLEMLTRFSVMYREKRAFTSTEAMPMIVIGMLMRTITIR